MLLRHGVRPWHALFERVEHLGSRRRIGGSERLGLGESSAEVFLWGKNVIIEESEAGESSTDEGLAPLE